MPGLMYRRRKTVPSYAVTSLGSGGRGPTTLISPMSTFQNWGSSSSENLRRTVRRG